MSIVKEKLPRLVNPQEKKAGRDAVDIEFDKLVADEKDEINMLQEKRKRLVTAEITILIFIKSGVIKEGDTIEKAIEKMNSRNFDIAREWKILSELLRGDDNNREIQRLSRLDHEFYNLIVERKEEIDTECDFVRLTHDVILGLVTRDKVAGPRTSIKTVLAIIKNQQLNIDLPLSPFSK